jgi:GT2 family glycosyltransferase
MVTAIIVNYRDHLLTARAAASVLADQPEAQVIVVDNSADEAEAHLLQAALPPQATCLVAPENLGFGKGCNLGFEQARHEWILLLNPDAVVLSGCIATLVAFLEKNPAAGAAAPLVYWDREQAWLLPPAQLPTPVTELAMAAGLRWPWLGGLISRRFRHWALSCLRSNQPVVQQMLSGGLVMLRRTAIIKAGGLFDPDFFIYFEDTDLCRRLRKAGFQLYLVPQAKAIHAWQADAGKGVLAAESRLLYFHKQFPGSLLFAVREKMGQRGLTIRPPESRNLGLCSAPPAFPVPVAVQRAWLLEISPHPLLIPALYCFGNGDRGRISEEVWALLGPGHYWARLADPAGNAAVRFHWKSK